MNMNRWTCLGLVGALALLGGCGTEAGNLPPASSATESTSMPTSVSGTDGTDTDTLTDGTTSDGTAGTTESTETTGEGPTNCGQVQCSDHGSCVVDGMGVPYCVCDSGYVLDGDTDTCVVDTSCIQLRSLQDHCRQLVNGPPAVALFFSVDFCAGTAVTPDKLQELGLLFQVLEDGVDIAKNVESEATIIDKSVENYVMLSLDMSDSLAQNEDLTALITELRGLLEQLQPGPDEPDVYVSLQIFGRFVRELRSFTRDLQDVDFVLAEIAADPERFSSLVNGNGTALFEATKEGIENTQRIRDLREIATDDGVLTTGTVVVITDGNDTSNGTLDSSLITNTTNQVISIGISNQIQDEQLQSIGRDGSFLAPTPADWAQAFDEIAQRVDEYPDRSYLLAYCSSATEGSTSVEVSVQGPGLLQVTSAACQFDAEAFSSNPNATCDASLFTTECDAKACGGLTACGGCADTQCCAQGVCVGPQTPEPGEKDCNGQDEICLDGQVCDDDATEDFGVCVDPSPEGVPPPAGDPCDPGCEPGVTYCLTNDQNEPLGCVPVLGDSPGGPCDPPCISGVETCLTNANGDALGCVRSDSPVSCEEPSQCVSGQCYYQNPDNPLEGRFCLPEARIFDHCGSSDAVCEVGAFCDGSTCKARKRETESCSGDHQCRSAQCADLGPGNYCTVPDQCFWTWDEKIGA